MNKAISPSRTYVAVISNYRFEGYHFRKFILPKDRENDSHAASWYYINRIDHTSCIDGCFSWEDFTNLTIVVEPPEADPEKFYTYADIVNQFKAEFDKTMRSALLAGSDYELQFGVPTIERRTNEDKDVFTFKTRFNLRPIEWKHIVEDMPAKVEEKKQPEPKSKFVDIENVIENLDLAIALLENGKSLFALDVVRRIRKQFPE